MNLLAKRRTVCKRLPAWLLKCKKIPLSTWRLLILKSFHSAVPGLEGTFKVPRSTLNKGHQLGSCAKQALDFFSFCAFVQRWVHLELSVNLLTQSRWPLLSTIFSWKPREKKRCNYNWPLPFSTSVERVLECKAETFQLLQKKGQWRILLKSTGPFIWRALGLFSWT